VCSWHEFIPQVSVRRSAIIEANSRQLNFWHLENGIYPLIDGCDTVLSVEYMALVPTRNFMKLY